MKTINPLAVELCTRLYDLLKGQGIYPALTGGTLYKPGDRKDIDIVIYTDDTFDNYDTFMNYVKLEVEKVGMIIDTEWSAVVKGRYKGADVDLLFALKREGYEKATELSAECTLTKFLSKHHGAGLVENYDGDFNHLSKLAESELADDGTVLGVK